MEMSELNSGLMISIIALTAMAFAPFCGSLSDKIGSRWFGVVGMIIFACSMYLFNGLTATTAGFDLFWRLMIAGAGIGITMPPVISATIRNVPPDKVGMSSGITNMTRTLGTVFGISLLVAFMTFEMAPQTAIAKNQVINLIEKDEIFSGQLKNEMKEELNNPNFSIQDAPTLSDVISKMNDTEKKVLKGESPIAQFVTKTSFDKQEEEMKKIWPDVSDIFKDHAIKAFGDTFDFLGFLMIIGAIIAFFSDGPKSSHNVRECN